jgi:dienelactone hydrolase
MNRQRMVAMLICLLLTLTIIASAEEDLSVLPGTVDGIKANEMMKHYLLRQADQNFEKWKAEYEARKTSQQIVEYQKDLRQKFLEAIGGLPERTPLNPQITGLVHREGYRVEKVIFESQPKHYVTALLFLPFSAKYKPPYPGVLLPCGHAREAKAYDAYQTMGALLALNGMAALVFDPIDQGERSQMPSKLPEMWGTTSHTMVGVGSILLGRNTARFEIWDGIRAIDYLQSRPEVDPNRIGCTGNSGGGTQTSYLMALDDRILAASPSCYITSLDRLLHTIGPQDAEQNIFGQLAFGMDHADYLMMRAPKPTLICAATKDFFDIQGVWTSFRYAKRLYTTLDFAERIDLLENDAGHNYNRQAREGVARWMARWLLKHDEPITEPDIQLLSEEEVRCTPQGQVMLLEGARSTYDLNRDFEKQLAEHRKQLWATADRAHLLDKVRVLAGIRKLAELPKPELQEIDAIERQGYTIKRTILKPEDGIYLPALMFVPEKTRPDSAVLYVHEKGKAADADPNGPLEKLVKAGNLVLAVDLRGTGETQLAEGYVGGHFGPDAKDIYTAYLLGRSYVGMHAEDVLVCAEFLRQRQKGQVELIATGHVTVPALHAAALEPDLFGSVKLIRPLVSWSNIIELGLSRNQLVNTVHGALTTYDLPDLAATLADKLTTEQPLNALAEPIETDQDR